MGVLGVRAGTDLVGEENLRVVQSLAKEIPCHYDFFPVHAP